MHVAWVRYDDQFYANPKVTAVIAEDAGALALHVLANTWSNGQKRIGHIPAHQPGFLICDRSQGEKWAAVLVKHGLWHEVSHLVDCESCFEAYHDVNFGDGGYVIHDSHKYRAPSRERTTPGTPSDLSEKRREAGRKGGKSSAAKREQAKQDAQASQANGVSKSSNLLPAGVSPEPVPGSSSNEEELPEPQKTSLSAASPHDAESDSREDVERLCKHLADRVEENGSKRPAITKKWRDAARLLMDRDGKTERQVHNMIDWCQDDEFWRGNVMAMPKLREQYDRMRLRAEKSASNVTRLPSPGSNPKQFTEEDYLAGWN